MGGVATLDVAGDEEADKEVGQGGQVHNVEPQSEGLAGSHDAGLDGVEGLGGGGGALGLRGSALDNLGAGTEDELLQGVEGSRENRGISGLGSDGLLDGAAGNGDGDDVGDKGVRQGVGGTEQELGDLEAGKGALDEDGDLDRERGEGVVSVLVMC